MEKIPIKPEKKVKGQKYSIEKSWGKISKKRKSFLELVKHTSPKRNQPGNLGNRESYTNILEIEAEFN